MDGEERLDLSVAVQQAGLTSLSWKKSFDIIGDQTMQERAAVCSSDGQQCPGKSFQ